MIIKPIYFVVDCDFPLSLLDSLEASLLFLQGRNIFKGSFRLMGIIRIIVRLPKSTLLTQKLAFQRMQRVQSLPDEMAVLALLERLPQHLHMFLKLNYTT